MLNVRNLTISCKYTIWGTMHVTISHQPEKRPHQKGGRFAEATRIKTVRWEASQRHLERKAPPTKPESISNTPMTEPKLSSSVFCMPMDDADHPPVQFKEAEQHPHHHESQSQQALRC